MALALLKQFARRLFAPRPSNPIRTAPRFRPGVEGLEDRVTPTTWNWVGSTAGNGVDMSVNTNWLVNGSIPTQFNPQSGDILAFGAGAKQTAVIDDLQKLTVGSIQFTANGYTLLPQAGNVANTDTVTLTSLTLSGPANAQATVGVNLTFTPAASTAPAPADVISATTGTSLRLSSPVVDNSGYNLTVGSPTGSAGFDGVVTLNDTVTNAQGQVTFHGSVVGSGNLTINQPTTATGVTCELDDAANNLTGQTVVTKGNVGLGAPTVTGNNVPTGYYAVSNSLIVGTFNAGTFLPTAHTPTSPPPVLDASVILFGNNEIPGTSASGVTVFPDGELSTGNYLVPASGSNPAHYTGYTDAIGALLMQGGLVDTTDYATPKKGYGPTVNGALALGGDVTILAFNHSAVINGQIDLGNASPARGFNLDSGNAVPDLDIEAIVTSATSNTGIKIQGYTAPSNPALAAVVAGLNGDAGYTPTAVPGMMELDGTNSYTGTTQVAAGVLIATNAQSLGATSATNPNSTTVSSGGSLWLYNTSADTTFTFQTYALTLNGTGAARLPGDQNLVGFANLTGDKTATLSGGGALQGGGDTDGAHMTTITWPGSVTLQTTSTIVEEDFNTLGITGTVQGSGGLIKTGTGTVALNNINNDNTYTGATEVADGILTADENGSLGGSGAGTSSNPDPTAGTTVDYSGALQLANGVTVGTQNGAGETLTMVAAGGTYRYDFEFNAVTTLSYAISATGKAGDADNFTGTPANATRCVPPLFSNGSNTWNGAIVLAPNTVTPSTLYHVAATDGDQLTLNGVISDLSTMTASGPFGNLVFGQSDASLTYAVKVSGSTVFDGTVLVTGANTYADTTEVRYGALAAANANALGSPVNGGIAGAVNGATTVDSGATLQLTNVGAGTNGIAFDSTEKLNLNGSGMSGAAPATGETGYGALQNISGTNTWQGPIYLASSALISATVYQTTYFTPTGFPELITVNAPLTISGSITDANPTSGTPNTLSLGDRGHITLSGNNTYSAYTDILAHATVILQNPNALGEPTSSKALNGNTTVESSAVLELGSMASGPAIPEALVLAGGALLENLANDTNNWGGQITLAGNATIRADAGSNLTVSGVVQLFQTSAKAYNLQVDNIGSLTFSNNINDVYTPPYGPVKVLGGTVTIGDGVTNSTDTGTVTYSYNARYTYSGLTDVKDGTLILAVPGGASAILSGPIQVESGASVQYGNGS